MTSETKLLTEGDVRVLWAKSIRGPDGMIEELRERGLIAPEPVDAIAQIAKEIRDDWLCGKAQSVEVAILAALRRGMELQREAAPLTRERVQEAVDCISYEVFGRRSRGEIATRLYAALTEAQQ